MSAADETIGYARAIQDLEEILARIEEDEVDIDALAAQLQRATELLEICRGKIRKAETEVRQIVDQLNDSESADGSAGGAADDAE